MKSDQVKETSPNLVVSLITLTLGSFLSPFMSSSINIALPAIGKEFSWNAILLGWVATSFLLTSTILLLPFGRLADLYGRKKIFLYGACLFSLASLLGVFFRNPAIFFLFRVLQGIGSAMITSTAIAIISSIYPQEKRGQMVGINSAVVYLALTLGPLAGGFLVQTMGWRSIFVISAILGLACFLLAIIGLKGEWQEAHGNFDTLGAVTYGLMLIMLIYGLSSLPEPKGYIFILLGALGSLLFIRLESKMPYPLLDLSLFRSNRVFAFSNVAALINYCATFAVNFLMSLFLQYIKGFAPQTAGLVLISQSVVQVAFSPLAGKLSDSIEPRIVSSLGMILVTVGLALLAFLSPQSSLFFILGSLSILGLGYALFVSPNTNAIMGSVSPSSYGVASALVSTMRLTGQVLSMGIAMLLMTLLMGQVEITPQYHAALLTSIKAAFVLFTCLSFAGIFFSMARGYVRKGN